MRTPAAPDRNELALFPQSDEQLRCLIGRNTAQIRSLEPLDTPVRLDISKHHLFLLEAIEPGLADIRCRFPFRTVDSRAERIRPAPCGAVRLDQDGREWIVAVQIRVDRMVRLPGARPPADAGVGASPQMSPLTHGSLGR